MANKNYLGIVMVSIFIVLAIVLVSSYFTYQNMWESFFERNATENKVNALSKNQNSVDSRSNSEESFKLCSVGVWGCKSISQGENTGVQAPSVCGCIPECVSGLHLVVSSAGVNEMWPDDSSKGLFECSKELPP